MQPVDIYIRYPLWNRSKAYGSELNQRRKHLNLHILFSVFLTCSIGLRLTFRFPIYRNQYYFKRGNELRTGLQNVSSNY